MARKSVLRIELEALTSKLVSGFKQGEQASRSLKAELGKTEAATLDVRDAQLKLEAAQSSAARAASSLKRAQADAAQASSQYAGDSLKAEQAAVRLSRAERGAEQAAFRQRKAELDLERASIASAHAADKHTHSVGKLDRALGKVQHTGSHLGRHLLAAGGFGALAFGLHDVTEEAVKAQAEQFKMANAVDRAGISWKHHRHEVEAWLDETSRASGFLKSDLTASFSNFVRATGSVEKAQHLVNLAMDVARTKNTSLAGAQSLVARAYLGSTRGLKALGIEVKPVTAAQDKLKQQLRETAAAYDLSNPKTQSAIDKLKSQAKAQDTAASRTEALALIQKKFGGQSEAYAKSSAGQFEKARASINVAQEQIGSVLLPAIASVAQETAKVATSASEHWPEIKKEVTPVAKAVGHVASGIAGFVKQNPKLAAAAASFAIIGGAAVKLGKFSGATSVLKLAFQRGNTPLTPMYVIDVTRGGGGKRTLLEKAGGVIGRAGIVRAAGVAGAAAFGLDALGAFDKHKARGIPQTDNLQKLNQRLVIPGVLQNLLGGGPSDVQRFGDAVARLPRDLAKVDPHVLQVMRDRARALADEFPKNGKALNDFAKLADSALNHVARQLDRDGRLGRALHDSGVAWGNYWRDPDKSLKKINDLVNRRGDQITKSMGRTSLEAKIALASNYTDAMDAVLSAWDKGIIGVKTKNAEMEKLTRRELALFGIKGKTEQNRYLAGQDTITGKNLGGGSSNRTGKAVGGWIGRRGEAGTDTVPVMLGRGEAVLNRHQQPIVESALAATYGTSLDGLFASVNTPHYMASGGRVPRQKMTPGLGVVTAIGQRGLDVARSAANARLGSVVGGDGGPHGAGVTPTGDLKAWLTKALRITGHYSPANLRALTARAIQESGGNPRAINLWDSNAKKGTPSKGLLQTIDPTFQAYALKGHGDIWNPVDNAIAAVRYMFARYGYVVGGRPGGYASGGFIKAAGGLNLPGATAKPHAAAKAKKPRQNPSAIDPFTGNRASHSQASWDAIRAAFKSYSTEHRAFGSHNKQARSKLARLDDQFQAAVSGKKYGEAHRLALAAIDAITHEQAWESTAARSERRFGRFHPRKGMLDKPDASLAASLKRWRGRLDKIRPDYENAKLMNSPAIRRPFGTQFGPGVSGKDESDFQRAYILAQERTPNDTSDDLAVAGRAEKYYQSIIDAAKRGAPVTTDQLQAAVAGRNQWRDAANPQTDGSGDLKDLIAQQIAGQEANRALIQQQGPQLMAALAAFLNGDIGGSSNLAGRVPVRGTVW